MTPVLAFLGCGSMNGSILRGVLASGVPVEQVLAPVNPADALRDRNGFASLDLTDLICPEGLCRPVVGNVHVFFDPHHLTWTYARTMAPALETRLPGTLLQEVSS